LLHSHGVDILVVQQAHCIGVYGGVTQEQSATYH